MPVDLDVGVDLLDEGQLLTVLEIPEMQDDLTRALAAKRRTSDWRCWSASFESVL